MNKREKIKRAEEKYNIKILKWNNETGRVLLLKDGYEFELSRHSLGRCTYPFRSMTYKGQQDWYNANIFADTGFEVIDVDKTHLWIKNLSCNRVTRQLKCNISVERAERDTRC